MFRCQRVVRVALRVDPGGTSAGRHGVTLRQLANSPVHRQWRKRLGLIRLMQIRVIIFVRPGLRVERDAVADRGIARHQIAALGAQIPRPGLPARRAALAAPNRKDKADHFVEFLFKYLAQTFAFHRVVEPRVERIDIDRQLAFAPQVVPDVFVGGENVFRIEREFFCDARQKSAGLLFSDAVAGRFVGKQRRIFPDRLAVFAPVQIERPARQLLAWIPLALAVVQQAEGCVF